MKTQPQLVLPCLRGVMGKWVFYSSLMTAQQIKDWIQPAKSIREAKALDDLLQRDLKERRKAIAKYLLNNQYRFFNSLVVGVFDGIPDWIQFNVPDSMPIPNITQLDSKYLSDSIGLMAFKGDEKMFAIDGQHRVSGIEIAVQEDHKRQELKDDQYPIIFVAHLDDKLGKKRTRKLFSDINKHAKPVAPGDKIKIDEEDLSAIVTRRIYAGYKHFNGGKIISLTESAKLDPSDVTFFTNLLTLYNVNKKLEPLFKKVRGTNAWDEENVIGFQKIAEGFYDYVIANITEYHSYFITKKLLLKKTREQNKYLLFRPVGLVLLARLYTYFSKKDDLVKFSSLVNKIGFIFPDSPFNKVLWDNGKMEAKQASQTIAYNLALYLLGEYPAGDLKGLLKKYREITKDEQAELPGKVITSNPITEKATK